MRPLPTDYAPYYGGYIQQVPEEDIVSAARQQWVETLAWWRTIPDEVGEVVHEPYRWSVRQVLMHLIDTERVFAYRLLRFVRRDATELAGFDENAFAVASLEMTSSVAKLVEEWDAVRHANLLLLEGLGPAHWELRGMASGHEISVRAVAYILVGHIRHHDAVLKKRLGR